MAWNTFIYFFIDLIFPPKDIEGMTAEEFLRIAPPRTEVSEDGVCILWNYRTPLIKSAIWEMKFRGNRKVAALLGGFLYQKLITKITSEKILLIPVPMSKNRRKEKGFNQVELLLDAVKIHDVEERFQLEKNILTKIRNTPRQVSIKNRENRLRNLIGAFGADESSVRGRTIFLVDDVTTTGATLAEAKKTLLSAGAKKVFCFALAH